MDETKAREILGDSIKPNNNLRDLHGEYLNYHADNKFVNDITLDGDFTPDELEAIVWWMRNKSAYTL